MSVTRRLVIEEARKARRVRMILSWCLVLGFSIIAFAVSGTQRWAQLTLVVFVAAGLLGSVLLLSSRAADQRKRPTALIALVGLVCFVPPLFVVLSQSRFLESFALMRILLILVWVSIGIAVWTLLDRWRRRKPTMDETAWIGFAIALATLAIAVVPPIPGLAAVGRPETMAVDVIQTCPDQPRTVQDGLLAELTATPTGEKFAARTKDGNADFEGVPVISTFALAFYIPKAVLKDYKPIGNDGHVAIMDNGDARVTTANWPPQVPREYTAALASLLTAGLIEVPIHHVEINLGCFE